MNGGSGEAIPEVVALQLCSEIRNEKKIKLFTQCWGCVKFSKGDPAKMCFSSQTDNRGCSIVNKRYDERHPP
jgi:recombinational DNA repair protein RecR